MLGMARLGVVLVLFLLESSAAMWPARYEHQALIARIDALSREVTAHADEERGTLYKEHTTLRAEFDVLQSVEISGSAQAIDTIESSYSNGLDVLAKAFFRIDSLLESGLHPLETQRAAQRKQCTDNLAVHEARLQDLQDLLERVSRVRLELQSFAAAHDITPEEQEELAAHLQTEVQSLITAHSGTHPPAPSPDELTDTQRVDFVKIQARLIDTLSELVGQEIDRDTRKAEEEANGCKVQDERIRVKIVEAGMQLDSAEEELGTAARVFAEMAKRDVASRMEGLATLSKSTAEMRERVRGTLDDVTRGSELVSTSLCMNDCSGHGVCVGGDCRCDSGYGGADCGSSTH